MVIIKEEMKVEMKLEMILLDDKTSNQEKKVGRKKKEELNVLSDSKIKEESKEGMNDLIVNKRKK